MRFRSTLILALLFLGLGVYVYFVEFEQAAKEGEKQTLFDFAVDDVAQITLAYPDREIVVERKDDTWKLASPIEAAADETAVANLVRAVAECEVKKTIDEPPEDLSPYGLKAPKVTVKVKLKDRDLPAIRVGKTTPVGFSTYLQRADEKKVYLTTSAFQSGMDKQVKDLRDKKILDVDEAAVRRVTLRRPAGSVVLRKDDGDWRIVEPTAYDADQEAVRRFLSAVRSLRAKDFPSEDAADLHPFGLDQPRLTIELATAEDTTPTQILFGKESDGKSVYVKIGARPTIYAVGDWSYRDANKNVNDFRDKKVLPADAADVREIQVARADGETFALTRVEGGTWSMKDRDTTPDAAAVDRFLDDLVRLEGYEIAAEEAGDLGQFGLAPPALTITLLDADGAEIAGAIFGSHTPKPPTKEVTAKRTDAPAVFHVREYQYSRVDKRAADFLPKPTPTASPAVRGS
jgi:hypothetical protein